MVTIDYILIGVAVLLAILDVVMSIIHFKPVPQSTVLEDATLEVSSTNNQEVVNNEDTANVENIQSDNDDK